MWAPQIEALQTQGYRVIAPDTLGCGESEIGRKVSDYQASKVAADHAALLRHLQVPQAHIVGHDWGAVIAWVLAGEHPELTKTLTVLSVGHPNAYGRSGLPQKLKGWYTFYFLLRWISERLLQTNSIFGLHRVFGSHPNMEEVMPRLREKGRMLAAIRLYRANVIAVLFGSYPSVQAPTLGIWSEQDAFLVESQMKQSEKWVTGDWEYEQWSGRHWISIEQADKLNARLLAHFQKNS